jgi:hypothetical protein
MARRESSTLRINVEIKDRDVAVFNARLGEMETKAGSASGAVDRTSGSIKKAGQSSAATAVHFQTMTQGMLNLATTGAQVFTSMSNLDRAANRLAMAQVGLARAQDLYNNKEIRLQDLRKRGEGSTKKAIQLEKELGTAKADLAVKTDKLRIEEGALNDVRILFATNIANVMVSSLQTIKTMKDLNIASTIKLAFTTRVLGSTFVKTGIQGKVMVPALTMIGTQGMVAAKGMQLLTIRLRTLLVTLGPIAAGFVAMSVAYQAFEEDWGGFGTAMKNTFPFLRDLTALQDEAKDSIDNWAGANNDLADTYDNMEGKAKKSLTRINQMQADFLKQRLSDQNHKDYIAHLKIIAEFGGGTPQGFNTGSSGLPIQTKGIIGNIPGVPSLLGGGILLEQKKRQQEQGNYSIQNIIDLMNSRTTAIGQQEQVITENDIANQKLRQQMGYDYNKYLISSGVSGSNTRSWAGTGVTGATTQEAVAAMQGGGYGQERKALIEENLKLQMSQREHLLDFNGITDRHDRMFVKQHGYLIKDGQRINFSSIQRMGAIIHSNIRELEIINYTVPDQEYTPSDPTKIRDYFTSPSSDLSPEASIGLSKAHQPRRVYTDRINAMFGESTGSNYNTSIAERLLGKMSGDMTQLGTAREGSTNFRINKATGEIITLPTGASGALAYAKAVERLSLEHGSANAHMILNSGMRDYGLKSEAEQVAEFEARKGKDRLDPMFMSEQDKTLQSMIYGGSNMDMLRNMLGGGEEVSQNQMFAYKQITQNSINVIKINSDTGKAYVSSTTTARANRSMAAAQAMGRATWNREQNQNKTVSSGGNGGGIVSRYNNSTTSADSASFAGLAASHDSQVREYGKEAFERGKTINLTWLIHSTQAKAKALNASISARIAAERSLALQLGGQIGISQTEALVILRDQAQGEQTLRDMAAFQMRLDAMSSGVVS